MLFNFFFAVGDAKIITKETTSGIFVEEAVIIWNSSIKKSTGMSTVYVNFYEIQSGKLLSLKMYV